MHEEGITDFRNFSYVPSSIEETHFFEIDAEGNESYTSHNLTDSYKILFDLIY